MTINLWRYNSDKDHTNGLIMVDGKFICYSIEDEYQAKKVYSETRIPNGIYDIKLRSFGGFHERYLSKYGDWHKGMLQVMNVPNFEDILIHKGNSDKDTAGCILTGSSNFMGANWVEDSTNAYEKLYPIVRDALLSGDEVKIVIRNLDILT